MSLLKKIDDLIEESESILTNLLIFADFDLLNSQARAYNILNATVIKFKYDIDNNYILQNVSNEDRRRIYLDKTIVLKKLIKYSKNYLKNIVLDMSQIKYAYIDKKKLHTIVKKIKKDGKYKKVIFNDPYDNNILSFDGVRAVISYDIDRKDTYVKICDDIHKFIPNQESTINDILKKLKDVGINYRAKFAFSVKIYSNDVIIDCYLAGNEALFYEEVLLENYNKDLILKILSKDFANLSQFKGKTSEDIYENFEEYLKINFIEKY